MNVPGVIIIREPRSRTELPEKVLHCRLTFHMMLRGLSIRKLLLVPLLEELVWWSLPSVSSLPVKILENSEGRVLKGQIDFYTDYPLRSCKFH